MAPRVVSLHRADRALLLALAALLSVLVVELWSLAPPWSAAAQAQLPNAGMQRVQQTEEVRRTNELLERIARRLETGPVPVRIEKAAARGAAEASP